MITKKEFCRMIITNFARENGINLTDMKDEDLIPHIYSSTRLGIALEYLGVLTPESDKEAYEYLQTRGGIEYTAVNWDDKRLREKVPFRTSMLSTRELIDLLPVSHVVIGDEYICSSNKARVQVTDLKEDEETGELMVHYVETATGVVWKPIPESEWLEEVKDEETGYVTPRFIHI